MRVLDDPQMQIQHFKRSITNLQRVQMTFHDQWTCICIYQKALIYTNHCTFIQMRTFGSQVRSSVFVDSKTHLCITEYLWIRVRAFTRHLSPHTDWQH